MVSKLIRTLVLLVFALCLPGRVPAAAANPNANADESQANTSTRPSDPKLYAGTDTCLTCHEEIGKSHQKGPHAKTELGNNGAAFQGCEGCHGPGKAHAEGGGDTSGIVSFRNLSKAESTGICLDCHGQGKEHANYLQSQHGRNKIGCVDCHSSHRAKVQAGLLKSAQPQLCYGCHKDLKPEPGKPAHHDANAAQAECTSCHSPHGGKRSQTQNPRAPQLDLPRGDHPLADRQDRTGETTTRPAAGSLRSRPFIPNHTEES